MWSEKTFTYHLLLARHSSEHLISLHPLSIPLIPVVQVSQNSHPGVSAVFNHHSVLHLLFFNVFVWKGFFSPRNSILLKQGFLFGTLDIWTFDSLLWGHSVPCRMFNSLPDLYPLDPSSTLRSCDNQKCVQTLPSDPCRTKINIAPPPNKNLCSKRCFTASHLGSSVTLLRLFDLPGPQFPLL